VTQILVGWPADHENATLTAVGNLGVHFVDGNGVSRKEIRFSKGIGCPVEVMRLDAGDDYGFLTRNESWSTDATVFDKQGQVLWTYPSRVTAGIDDSVGANLDANGNSGVLIGFNGDEGIILADMNGKKIGQKPEGNVWHVETLDVYNDGRKEILHSNSRGHLIVRDGNGEIIDHYIPDHYVSDFALTRWGSEAQPSHILVPTMEPRNGCCSPVMLILDAKGKTVTRFDASLGDLMHSTHGTPVHFPKSSQYYAALQTNLTLNRSVLTLYDGTETIAYQEVLGGTCFSIASLPGPNGDRLLIGCSGEILEYSLSNTTNSASVGAPPQNRRAD